MRRAFLLTLTLLGLSRAAMAQTLLTRERAEKLALTQASTYEQAKIQEKITAEDVRIAHAALAPKLAVPVAALYDTPALGPVPNGLRPAAFLAANGINEYQAGLALSGTLDISGNLHAAMQRSVELLAAAHAGTEVAARLLVGSTDEAYFALALAHARVAAARLNLGTAQEAERVTSAMLKAGEVAAVDQVRVHLVTQGRQDELEQAVAAETVAAHALRVLVGYSFTQPLDVVALEGMEPATGELDAFRPEAVEQRWELAQFAAQRRANEQELRQAKTELRPQLTYSLNLGFDSSTLSAPGLYQHTGLAGAVYLNIPLSDGGAAHARERQAVLREQLVDSQQAFYTAREQAVSAANRLPLSRASLNDAEQDVRVSVARYRSGEATVIEVTDAQARLATQRSAYDQAVYD